MRFLLKCFVTDQSNLCSRAVVEVTPDLVDIIQRRKNYFDTVYLSDQSALKLCYFDHTPKFYDFVDTDQLQFDQLELLESYGLVEIPESFKVPSPVNIESCLMAIYGDRVAWSCVPRETELRVETETIPYKRIFR